MAFTLYAVPPSLAPSAFLRMSPRTPVAALRPLQPRQREKQRNEWGQKNGEEIGGIRSIAFADDRRAPD